jgi:Rps23 Pro-64 3,4-dihydroxylase Tpa1-like proline 4-hydroxylase
LQQDIFNFLTSDSLDYLLENLDNEQISFQTLIEFTETMGLYFKNGWKAEANDGEWKIIRNKISKTDQILELLSANDSFINLA